jgi:hypothetical protein
MKPPHSIRLTGRILSRMPLISPAERLDAAIEALLDARRRVRRGRDGSEGELVGTAALLQAALPPLPPGRIFEERLARRLAVPGLALRLRERAATARRAMTPTRLIAAGAVSSAAVGVTALAMWRGGRRQAGGHR